MTQIMYSSTRGGEGKVTASQAILAGLAPDGGLYVPETFPVLDFPLGELADLDYQEMAFRIMRLFLTDFTEEELRACIRGAYDSKFDTPVIAPLHEAGGVWYLELYHGATIAFKDMALSILPYLMTTAAKKNNLEKQIVILTATSGDTGKAALAGFADVPGTKIAVFYPKNGVSPIQERQMVTQTGDNVTVIGIEGNFDDAQSKVKEMLTDPALACLLDEHGYQFSSANSINIGRLVPQIVYYAYAYGQLCKAHVIQAGDPINVTVPTGNFGNILAAYYARAAGIPIRTLICASNENKVLYDFFRTGVYDKNRPFLLTTSPSMDILISSNLERLIYQIGRRDSRTCAAYMQELSKDGAYRITPEMRDELNCFYGNFASVKDTASQIRKIFESTGYLIDPHTAVGSFVCDTYREETGDETPAVVASTASPYKFTRSVMEALGKAEAGEDDFELADKLSGISETTVPDAVAKIRNASVLHDKVVKREEMQDAVLSFLNIQ